MLEYELTPLCALLKFQVNRAYFDGGEVSANFGPGTTYCLHLQHRQLKYSQYKLKQNQAVFLYY